MGSAASGVLKSLNIPPYIIEYENTKFFRIRFIVNSIEKTRKDASGDATEPSRIYF